MNSYQKKIVLMRFVLWGVTLALIAAIVTPAISYLSQGHTEKRALLSTSNEASGLTWYLEHNKVDVVAGEKPELVYLNDTDQLLGSSVDSIEDNVVVGEMLFSRLGGDLEKRDFLENLIQGKYQGYVAKSFAELSDYNEVPESIIKGYEKTSGAVWRFNGKGIAIMNDDAVYILQSDVDYEGGVYLESENGRYPYTGYFELIQPLDKAEAVFDIHLTESGRNKMDALGLGGNFGALLSVSNRLYDGYYFAGEFSKINVEVPSSYASMDQLMSSKVLYDTQNNELLYWKWYYPMLDRIFNSRHDIRPFMADDGEDNNLFYVEGHTILKRDGDEGKPFFIKGVNLGAALPGKTFTEFPKDKAVYASWLQQMRALNINTIRVYTLLPPTFYQALYEYNEASDQTIYLLQEIWPEEYPADHNYLGEAYNKTYHQEIEYAVHAMHGNVNIPKRDYRAYGMYNYDVSKYLMGYLVGREMEPEEVKATDALNAGYGFTGRYLYSVSGATPTEAWLASGCDYALKIENMFYSDSPLVAIVSWPTLDPKSHDSEWNAEGDKSKMYNDSAVVDIDNIGINASTVTGFFGAYHIYPNYPDFMNNEKAYDAYSDDEGRFRYGGYLEEFMAGHVKYPAVVAEYGISTSQVAAHYSPDGYDHGGLSEEMQGQGIVRMTKSIINEGYSGAIIFEWMDEWAKKTWTTEPYMIPYNKNPFWHNKLDPEQNYGLMAVEPEEAKLVEAGSVALGQNESYLYLDVDVSQLASDTLTIAIDTIHTSDSEAKIPEFILRLGPVSTMKANPGYNWTNGMYESVMALQNDYEDLEQIINKENTSMYGDVTLEKRINLSRLKYGDFGNPVNCVNLENDVWHVRIPYGLLGISDPTENRVLFDSRRIISTLRDQIETVEIDSIELSIAETGEVHTFGLKTWDQPNYQMRYKRGVEAIADYFEKID